MLRANNLLSATNGPYEVVDTLTVDVHEAVDQVHEPGIRSVTSVGTGGPVVASLDIIKALPVSLPSHQFIFCGKAALRMA